MTEQGFEQATGPFTVTDKPSEVSRYPYGVVYTTSAGRQIEVYRTRYQPYAQSAADELNYYAVLGDTEQIVREVSGSAYTVNNSLAAVRFIVDDLDAALENL